jgi:hypothetical protein
MNEIVDSVTQAHRRGAYAHKVLNTINLLLSSLDDWAGTWRISS